MDLYQTIFKRRSVRSFDFSALDNKTLKNLHNYLETIEQLVEFRASFKIATGEQIGNNKAPYFILVFAENTTAALINVGYFLAKADLYLQSLDLGSLFLGMAKPKGDSLDCFSIMMAFGKTRVPYRKDEKDFKRLLVEKISNQSNDIARAARLAPSAVNSEPWQLVFGDKSVSINYFGRGILKQLLKRKMSKIDIGIMTRYVEIALLHEGRNVLALTLNDDEDHFGVRISYE
ncbi:MAG: hypothetical protein LBR37_03195 [Erysipelotrichaceae bacterium]|jgi:hypothetical protein|nr:hypothetical protein [Erysipelotrichaceae bacterium]